MAGSSHCLELIWETKPWSPNSKSSFYPVTPAEAGPTFFEISGWIPAFAGMTAQELDQGWSDELHALKQAARGQNDIGNQHHPD
jgi:hypothetical protein